MGNWNAQQPDGSSIATEDDGRLEVHVAVHPPRQDSRAQRNLHRGRQSVDPQQGNTPAMVGQVASLGDDRFNFKLANDNPSDPGLTFSK